MIEYIQSILLLISAFLIIVSAIGLISLDKDVKNVVYGRIHIVGVFDIACIFAMICLGQYFLAAIYFILAPFTAHAIANAYWKNEDRENNLDLATVEKVDDDNPFLHPRDKIQTLESEDSVKLKTDEKFSVAMLEIDEGE